MPPARERVRLGSGAARRSRRRARLKKAHQMMRSKVKTNEVIIAFPSDVDTIDPHQFRSIAAYGAEVHHFGPDGAYFKEFSPDYFTDRYENEWGEPLNFDGPDGVGSSAPSPHVCRRSGSGRRAPRRTGG